MKKPFRYLMLLAMAMFATVAFAQPLTLEQAGLKEGQGYTVKTKARGWWSVTDMKLERYSYIFANWEHPEDAVQDTEPNGSDINQNFGFVEVDGKTYLYSLGAGKTFKWEQFNDGHNDAMSCKLVDISVEAAEPVYIFFTKGNAYMEEPYIDEKEYWFFSFLEDHSAHNFNDNGTRMVIDNWTTPDDGNQYTLVEGDFTFDPAPLKAAIYEKYIAAEKAALLEALLECIEMGADVSEYQAVYDDPNATVEQIHAAIEALKQVKIDAASPEHPIDMTYMIVNPNFDQSPSEGWVSTTEDQRNNRSNAESGHTPGFSGDAWDQWLDGSNANGGLQGKLYQEIEGLPEGVYAVGLSLFGIQYMFANDEELFVNSANGRYYLMTVVGEDGKLTFGTENKQKITYWMMIDTAELTYYGHAQDSYRFMSTFLQNEADENYPETDEQGDPNYSTQYYTALAEIVAQANATNTPEEAVEVYHVARDKYSDLIISYNYYQRVKEELASVEDLIYQQGFEGLIPFQEQLEDILESHNITNEDLATLLADLRDNEIVFVKENIEPGQEYPYILKSFNKGSVEGWDLTGTDCNQNGHLVEFWKKKGWNMHQELEGMKPGVWRLIVQGYYRPGEAGTGNNSAWRHYVDAGGRDEGQNKTLSFASINGVQTPLCNMIARGLKKSEYPDGPGDCEGRTGEVVWFTGDLTDPETGETETYYFPDRMNCAQTCFEYKPAFIPGTLDLNPESYVTDAKGIVGKDGNISLRIWNSDYDNFCDVEWTAIGNVWLIYQGNTPEDLQPILQMVIEQAMQLYAQPMIASEKQVLKEALDQANAALSSSDGEVMFEAVNKVNEAIANVTTIDAYKELQDYNDQLVDNIDIYSEKADENVLAKAESLYYEILDGIAAGSYTIEECKAKIEEIKELLYALKIPKGTASDANPLDYTPIVVNPNYTQGTTGWTIPGGGSVEQENEYGMGVAEIWNANGEISQTITHLPAGTYKLKVQGYYRQNGFSSHMKTFTYDKAIELGKLDWLESADTTNVLPYECSGRFFANNDSIEPANYSFLPKDEDEDALLQSAPGSGIWSEYEWWLGGDDPDADGIIYYFPEKRLACANRFTLGFYENEFFAYVSDEGDGLGTLKIGMRIQNQHGNDWVPFTNWRLYYYGTESQYEDQTHKPSAINDVNSLSDVTRREVYTLDGRQQQTMHRGLNIVRMQTADGRTIVRKVLVK